MSKKQRLKYYEDTTKTNTKSVIKIETKAKTTTIKI